MQSSRGIEFVLVRDDVRDDTPAEDVSHKTRVWEHKNSGSTKITRLDIDSGEDLILELNLRGIVLQNDKFDKEVLDVLKHNPVTELKLTMCNLRNHEAKMLAQHIKDGLSPGLRVIHLAMNHITDDGKTVLLNALKARSNALPKINLLLEGDYPLFGKPNLFSMRVGNKMSVIELLSYELGAEGDQNTDAETLPVLCCFR